MDNIFSWQEENYDLLCKLFQDEAKLLFIHGRDFESPYHVLNILSSHLIKNGFVRFQIGSEEFPIVKDTTPNMMNPRLYTTSYNKPQGQQFDDTAVLSFIKLQYT